MLFYAHKIHAIGNVDDGDTALDFMEQERERGITIQSACVNLTWSNHTISLIDTPGHVDFTVEVERSLRVLDGAVGVFDGVKGVEAQTETVWKQANRYGIPRIALINKLDRMGANFQRAVQTMRTRLNSTPAILHIPVSIEQETGAAIQASLGEGVALGDKGNQVRLYQDWEQWHDSLHEMNDLRLNSAQFIGMVDVIDMKCILWLDSNIDPNGECPVVLPFPSRVTVAQQDLLLQAAHARRVLVETLCDFHEELGLMYLDACEECPDMPAKRTAFANEEEEAEFLLEIRQYSMIDSIPSDFVHDVLRACTIQNHVIPVLAGSSLKNKGTQVLLDSIIRYLPNPLDIPPIEAPIITKENPLLKKIKKNKSGNNSNTNAVGNVNTQNTDVRVYHTDPSGPMVALVFKIIHDPIRGPITFIRVFNGTLKQKDMLTNTSLLHRLELEQQQGNGKVNLEDANIRPMKILEINASDTIEVNECKAGSICALVGMKNTRTGDTLVVQKYAKEHNVELQGIAIPEPVFICGIETTSASEQVKLDKALQTLCLDDPSLRVEVDKDSGQTLIKGMGELHLEIIKQRLLTEYKIDAYLGKMVISHRESITDENEIVYTHNCMNVQGQPTGTVIEIDMHIRSTLSDEEDVGVSGADPIDIVFAADMKSNSKQQQQHEDYMIDDLKAYKCDDDESVQLAVTEGLQRACARGSIAGYQLTGFTLTVNQILVGGTNASSTPINTVGKGPFIAAVVHAITQLMKTSNTVLLEPIMKMEITTPDAYVGAILNDLVSRRRAVIKHVEQSTQDSNNNIPVVIHASVPLREVREYASILRGNTQGTGNFSMEFKDFQIAPQHIAQNARNF